MSTTPMNAPGDGFRLDINGLRAWAVMAVVLYHFGVPGISGGFVGVDVFFVISGFLMTGIIVSGLERSNFSLWSFYLSRARRIAPALLVLCLAVLVLGWFILMPKEYQVLGKHARESVLFTSNLAYLKEAGYFDSASHEKWLLHTWSLSVEWQFYLLQPLILLAVWKFFPRRNAVGVALFGLALISLGVCIWLTGHQPSKAFYQIQARAWELLLGGLVYLYGGRLPLTPVLRKVMELVGLALIVVALLRFDASSQWPGWLALLPTAGAALVLLACRADSLWTGNRVAQWLGTRSYSIYLWHWPLVVSLVYLERQAEPSWVLAGLLLSLLLGHLSYAWVEVPSRQRLAGVSRRRAAVILIVLVLLVAAAAQAVRRSGFPARLPESVAAIEAERHNRNPRQDECLDKAEGCVFGSGDIHAIVLGDSHADAMVTAVQAAAPAGQAVLFKGYSGCLVVFGAHYPKDKHRICESFNETLRDELPNLYPGVPVVLINRLAFALAGGVGVEAEDFPTGQPHIYFSTPTETLTPALREAFREAYVATVCEIARHHPVYLLRPTPEMGIHVPNAVGRALLLGRQRDVILSRADYWERQSFVWEVQDAAALQCGAQILDPLPYLCDDQRCSGTSQGRPVYSDDDHLSEFGNRLLVPLFRTIFAEPAAAR